jgi:hypothetical protein
VFSRIYGRPCWGGAAGVGSFLTLECGKPHLEIREPIIAKRKSSQKVQQQLAARQVHIRGDWHLWIYCCNWTMVLKGKLIGQSSVKSSIQAAADVLNGQKLIQCAIQKNSRSIFRFDLGAVLETIPYDDSSEQWLLFDYRVHKTLVVRADGYYAYDKSDDHGAGNWKPIEVGPMRTQSSIRT